MGEIILKLKEPITSVNYHIEEGTKQTIIIFNALETSATINLNVDVEKNATLNLYNVITSTNNAFLNQTINLCNTAAEVNVLNVILLGGKSKLMSNIMINHNVKETSSDFSTYAIAKDSAVMTLNNNAKIVKGAAKSCVHQKTKGLTLSKNSKIKAMPNLFIDEYDVIASHAASIGSISKEDLFYLMSRGLSEEESSKLIVLGFIRPLLDNVNDEDLRNEIKLSFEEKL